MNIVVIVNCDSCIRSISLDIKLKGMRDMILRSDLRRELVTRSWHDGMKCLCPKCKEINEKGDNCFNCKFMHYNDYNYRCSYTADIVTKYDHCSKYTKEEANG